jgi:hypothetical protein
MNVESLYRAIQELDRRQLADRIVSDLNVPSPRMGAEGPPNFAGPEEEYLVAIERLRDERAAAIERAGHAISDLFVQEAGKAAAGEAIERPILLFNLGSLLQAIKLPHVPIGLRALREYKEPLRRSLQEHHADLYIHLLLSNAVNQEAPTDIGFWLQCLASQDPAEVRAGVVGLRESGQQNACHYLPEVEKTFRRHPELGSFETEVMLLVDTYPDAPWPLCATGHFPEPDTDSEIPRLIRKHSDDRYIPTVDDLDGAARSAVGIVKAAGLANDIEYRRRTWTSPSAPVAWMMSPAGGPARLMTSRPN